MERETVSSSMIASAGYDAEQRILEVEFTSGAIYRYFNVPEQVYMDLINAESVGRSFDENIRDAGFAYERINS